MSAAHTDRPASNELPVSQSPKTVQIPETTPDQERGERIATGKTIARGGKTHGHVPGATEQSPRK